MTSLNIYNYFLLGSRIAYVSLIQKGQHFTVALPFLADLRRDLEAFTLPDTFPPIFLPSSVEVAKEILVWINEVFTRSQQFGYQCFTDSDLATVSNAVRRINTLLQKELLDSPIFCVLDKGNYSTQKLILGASRGLEQKLRQRLSPLCLSEIDEAGRCLALCRFTAAGFHSLRAVELVVRGYVKKASGSLPPVNRQNWGEYISQLKQHQAAREVTDLLQNVKDNHRNPLMHPEDTLDEGEAIDLFSISQTTIAALIRDVERRGI